MRQAEAIYDYYANFDVVANLNDKNPWPPPAALGADQCLILKGFWL